MKTCILYTLIIAVLCVTLSIGVWSSASPARILGDTDQNGTLNSADIRIMLRYIVGTQSLTAEQRTLADCDGNGRVDTLDVRYVLSVISHDVTPSTLPTTTTTTTPTTKPSLDDDGYYDEIVKP